MYAKLINNKLNYAPRNYNTSTSLITNFNKKANLMKKYGFKEIIDNKPKYDPATQYLSIEDYIENEENIVINYRVNEVIINNEPTLEERVADLEKLTQEQFKMIQELSLIIKEGE